jgi:activating signal cointegrator complex subunit 3
MMGRAGRPQFDDQGVAVIMVHDIKKHFYKKFLYEPFPVESSLLAVLSDHLNAEVVATTIHSKQEAMDYLTWTYFFRRLMANPSYYELSSLESDELNKYLSLLIQKSINELENSYCLTQEDDGHLNATTNGKIASFYYLSHLTMKMFNETLDSDASLEDLIHIISLAEEFDQLPVRHNEDHLNEDLSNDLPLKVNSRTFDNPHTKCNLLLQAHFTRIPLPSTDYLTDTKSVLDQCLRVLQAALDFSADKGWLKVSLSIINLIQMCCQGRWFHESDLLILPHLETEHLSRFYNYKKKRIDCLPLLVEASENDPKIIENIVGDLLDATQRRDIYQTLSILPQIETKLTLIGDFPMIPKKEETNVNRIELNWDVNKQKSIKLYADEDYVINVKLNQLKNRRSTKAYAPKYGKAKDENWILLLGQNEMGGDGSQGSWAQQMDIESSAELIAIKRLNNVKTQLNTNISFTTPTINNQNKDFNLSLYLMSDVYLGLDQQYSFKFNLVDKQKGEANNKGQ